MTLFNFDDLSRSCESDSQEYSSDEDWEPRGCGACGCSEALDELEEVLESLESKNKNKDDNIKKLQMVILKISKVLQDFVDTSK